MNFQNFTVTLFTEDVRTEERIRGGTKAREGEFPFVVSITKDGEHLCGGFIYNQRFIVTAASCVLGYCNVNIISSPHAFEHICCTNIELSIDCYRLTYR